MTAECANCGDEARQRCAGCSELYYCGRPCQRADWRRHKSACQPVCVRSADGVGRFTVASRQLPANQLVIRERPLAAGPQLDAEPQCLGCGRLVADGAAPCAGCRWPVCGDACAASAAHAAECAVLARDGGDRPRPGAALSSRYDCILPLRLLLLRDRPPLWDKVAQLESHADRRRDTDIYWDNQRHVVDYLRDRCAVDASEELLHRLCGVLDVNCFSMRARAGFGRRRGLFARTSLINHACVSNTQLSLDGDEMNVRTALPIAAGREVTVTYVSAFESTARRQDFLWHGKYFRCRCARCADPTEFGTMYGSHRCEQCSKLMLSSDPLDPDAAWRCAGCAFTQPGVQVRQLNELLHARRKHVEHSDVPELESFLRLNSQKPLHEGNYHVLHAKQLLAQAYGNIPGFMLDQLSDERLVAKELFCRQVIASTNVFEPGVSRVRGMLLVQLHHAVVTRAQRMHAAGLLSPAALLAKLEEGGGHLEEAISQLGHEPQSSPEGGATLSLAKDTLQGCYELAELVRSSLPK